MLYYITNMITQLRIKSKNIMARPEFYSTPTICLICGCILTNITEKNKKDYFCCLATDIDGYSNGDSYGPLCLDCQDYLESVGRIHITDK